MQQTERQARILPAPVCISGSAVCTAPVPGTCHVYCSEALKGLTEEVKNSPSCEGCLSCEKNPKTKQIQNPNK